MSDSFATPWTVALQAPLSMGFPRQENWSGLPLPSPGNLPNPGIESHFKSHGQRSLGGYSPWSYKNIRYDFAIKQQQDNEESDAKQHCQSKQKPSQVRVIKTNLDMFNCNEKPRRASRRQLCPICF